MTLKRLFNKPEQTTHARLTEVCARYGAHVVPKIRLADVFVINGSGISDDLFSYALKAHFDFVVYNDMDPEFAVEFDGPSHHDPVQMQNDHHKNALCEHFGLPILRIESEYLTSSFRGMDLLSWLVETWFLRQEFDRMQASGEIAYDEPFDSSFFIHIPGHNTEFPMWLAAEPESKIRKYWNEGRCKDMVSSHMVAPDENGRYLGIGWLLINDHEGVMVTAGIRNQTFPVRIADLLGQILSFATLSEFESVLSGKQNAEPVAKMKHAANMFRKSHQIHAGHWSGGFVD